MSTRELARRNQTLFGKTPGQLARDAVAQARTISNLTQGDALHGNSYAELHRAWLDAKNAGVMGLPDIHAHMSPQDMATAGAQIRKLQGFPGTMQAAQNIASRTPAGGPSAAPVASAPANPLDALSPVTRAILAPKQPTVLRSAGTPENAGPTTPAPRTPLDALQATMTASGRLQPGQNLVKNGAGYQVAATTPDGKPMSNPDGTARFTGLQPSADEALVGRFGDAWINGTPEQRRGMLKTLPAGNRGEVIDKGVRTIDPAHGTIEYQSPNGGTGIEYDPRRDATRMLAPADMLPPGASAGVVVAPKYRGTSSAVGSVRYAPAPAAGDNTGRVFDGGKDVTGQYATGGQYSSAPTTPVKSGTPQPSPMLTPSMMAGTPDSSIMRGVIPPSYRPPGPLPSPSGAPKPAALTPSVMQGAPAKRTEADFAGAPGTVLTPSMIKADVLAPRPPLDEFGLMNTTPWAHSLPTAPQPSSAATTPPIAPPPPAATPPLASSPKAAVPGPLTNNDRVTALNNDLTSMAAKNRADEEARRRRLASGSADQFTGFGANSL